MVRASTGPIPLASFQSLDCSEDCEIWTVRIDGTWGTGVCDTGAEERVAGWSQEERTPHQKKDKTCPLLPACRTSLEGACAGGQSPDPERVAPGKTQLSLQLLFLPLFREGSFKGMLMIPTKSSVGTRERRIDLIRMASPLPAWISCNAGVENKVKEAPTPPLHPTSRSRR